MSYYPAACYNWLFKIIGYSSVNTSHLRCNGHFIIVRFDIQYPYLSTCWMDSPFHGCVHQFVFNKIKSFMFYIDKNKIVSVLIQNFWKKFCIFSIFEGKIDTVAFIMYFVVSLHIPTTMKVMPLKYFCVPKTEHFIAKPPPNPSLN
jgi:hypothetical protein